MTENDAIKAIEHDLEWHSKELKPKYKEVLIFTIKALEEIQQYRAIGTIEEFKALKEKNVAKKPISSPTSLYGWDCPNCKNIVYNEYDEDDIMPPKHCDTCGQKLDWQ